MKNIEISKELKNKLPELTLGLISCDIQVTKINEDLWKIINKKCNELKDGIDFSEIINLSKIKESRDAYKKIGKDPSRYRLSSESLVRRIIKGKELYQINNVVDINNIISLNTFYSVGTYDLDKIIFPVKFTIGSKDDLYEGIGRGKLNIEKLPVLFDSVGPFGSSTSDSERTMVTLNTKTILMNIIAFKGDKNMDRILNDSIYLLKKYANAGNITTNIIK